MVQHVGAELCGGGRGEEQQRGLGLGMAGEARSASVRAQDAVWTRGLALEVGRVSSSRARHLSGEAGSEPNAQWLASQRGEKGGE